MFFVIRRFEFVALFELLQMTPRVRSIFKSLLIGAFALLSNYSEHVKIYRFAKFKKFLGGVQSHLKFSTIFGGSEPPSKNFFFKLCKQFNLTCILYIVR